MKNIEKIRSEQLARMFAALGNPHRLAIFERLRRVGTERCHDNNPELCVCDVAAGTGLSMSTVSHHLKELRAAQLVVSEKRGQSVYCTISPTALELIASFAGEAPAVGRQGQRKAA